MRALHEIPHLDSVGLRQVIATSVGLLYEKMGPLHTAKMINVIMEKCRPDDRPLTLQEVAACISQKHLIPVSMLRAPFKKAENENGVAHARQEAFWLARRQIKADGRRAHTLPTIGQFFGYRDHSTVLFGVRQHEARLLQRADA